jgi:hypothetical protein
MGLLDRAKQLTQTAKELKSELDKKGLLGGSGQASGPGPTPAASWSGVGGPPGAPPLPGSAPATPTPRTLAAGAGLPDPVTLLSAAAVGQALATPVAPAASDDGDDFIGARWRASSGKPVEAWVWIWHPWVNDDADGVTVDSDWATEKLEEIKGVQSTIDPVPSFGADAFATEEMVFFRRGPVVASVGARGVDVRAVTVALATVVAGALPAE